MGYKCRHGQFCSSQNTQWETSPKKRHTNAANDETLPGMGLPDWGNERIHFEMCNRKLVKIEIFVLRALCSCVLESPPKAATHCQTQSYDPISCYGNSVGRISEIAYSIWIAASSYDWVYLIVDRGLKHGPRWQNFKIDKFDIFTSDTDPFHAPPPPKACRITAVIFGRLVQKITLVSKAFCSVSPRQVTQPHKQ